MKTDFSASLLMSDNREEVKFLFFLFMMVPPNQTIADPAIQAVDNVINKRPVTLKDLNTLINTIAEQHSEDLQYSLAPLSPLLMLRGEPYCLLDYFPMVTLFEREMKRKTIFKCGRQVSKSTTVAAQGVLQSVVVPFFNTLFLCPRFEQIRRFSSNYVRPFVEHSVLTPLLVSPACEKSVLQRSMLNQSNMFFTFAFLDAERVRGISADKVVCDEIQDLDFDFLPVIQETMSASKWVISQFSGTPKTFDNTIEALWQESSMAEWVTKCTACNHWNIPSLGQDLMKMIGKKTVVCAKCERPIDPRYNGRYIHEHPDRISTFKGLHIPQIIMPMHYEDPEKWKILIGKRDSAQYPESKFMNEVLGESCDVGSKLVSLQELRAACELPFNNDLKEGVNQIGNYSERSMNVDWGGQGIEETSYTTVAIIGRKPGTMKLDVIYMERLTTGYNHEEEAQLLLKYFRIFRCQFMAHDYAGAGAAREAIMVQAGLPYKSIIPFNYVRATVKPIISYNAPKANTPRHYYSLDKTRSLVITCASIRSREIVFPRYESCQHLMSDFLNLIEERRDKPGGADVYLVTRIPKRPDDMAHSVNFGAMGFYHRMGTFPNLAAANDVALTQEQMDFEEPEDANWQ